MHTFFPGLSIQCLKQHAGSRIPAPPEIFCQLTQPAYPLREVWKGTLLNVHIHFPWLIGEIYVSGVQIV
jgi:hypothetical protein